MVLVTFIAVDQTIGFQAGDVGESDIDRLERIWLVFGWDGTRLRQLDRRMVQKMVGVLRGKKTSGRSRKPLLSAKLVR